MTAARKDPESSKVAKKILKSHTYNKTFNDWYMTHGRKKGRINLQGISEE